MVLIRGLLGFALFVVSVFADCPGVKNSDISPCVCLSNQVRCEGKSVTNEKLKSVFEKIDKSRPDYLKELEGLELYQTSVTELTTETFGAIILKTFIKLNDNPITSLALGNFPDLVFLDAANNKLTNISTNTFLGLKSLRYLNLGSNGIEKFPKDTFSFSNNLVRLVLSDNKISKLNSDEFSSEYNNNIELSEIDLSNNALTSLPANIFWPLRRPKLINLANNKLGTTDPDAFSFGEDVWQYDPIKIVLSGNGLKNSDLTKATFAKIARQKLTVEVDLSDNKLTALDATVFQNLLKANSNSVLKLNNNPIKCGDCANKWIVSLNPKPVIKLNKCSDDAKRTLLEFSQTDFKNCK